MTAKTFMIQGTSSSAGKSLLVTAFCHYFARQGVSVAPFKAQNMSNNAAVCPGGGEIGRAQAVQARAAGLEPGLDMNPVLIKPEADSHAQVILRGKPWDTLSARDYYHRNKILWKHITRSLDRLRDNYELVIIEGAGSPVELNLKENDIVNMAVARYARSPVWIVGDIDRGGIFSQLLGTYWLLPPEEQELVKGFIVNKFRGDRSLFADGEKILEELGEVPVTGVLPYVPDLYIPEEDAVVLETLAPVEFPESDGIEIGVVRLPRISNFDDFDPLQAEPGVRVRYLRNPDSLDGLQALILPGTKSTIGDLRWLEETGFDSAIQDFVNHGGDVVGICGGYQMLGREVRDPENVESSRTHYHGLGLLPIETIFQWEKATHRVRAVVRGGRGWMRDVEGKILQGYEIHMGQTRGERGWLQIKERRGHAVDALDGAVSEDGSIWGCYLHGIFDNQEFRRAWLRKLGWKGRETLAADADPFLQSLHRLTDQVESNLDMNYVERVIWES